MFCGLSGRGQDIDFGRNILFFCKKIPWPNIRANRVNGYLRATGGPSTPVSVADARMLGLNGNSNEFSYLDLRSWVDGRDGF